MFVLKIRRIGNSSGVTFETVAFYNNSEVVIDTSGAAGGGVQADFGY